jgi:hypothetical protein
LLPVTPHPWIECFSGIWSAGFYPSLPDRSSGPCGLILACYDELAIQPALPRQFTDLRKLSGQVGRIMRPGGLFLVLLFCAGSLFGCGGAESPPPRTNVHGIVTYLNRPLVGGTIVFIPDEERGNTGPLIHADIQPDGTYSLRTGELVGVVPGSYWVTVRSTGVLPTRGSQNWPQPPERYSDPRTSGLSCKVQAVEAHTINFYLQ